MEKDCSYHPSQLGSPNVLSSLSEKQRKVSLIYGSFYDPCWWSLGSRKKLNFQMKKSTAGKSYESQ